MAYMSKGGSGKASVSQARIGKTHKPMASGTGKGSGAKKDSATNTSSYGGGKTLRYRSGDVTRTTGSNAKYK